MNELDINSFEDIKISDKKILEKAFLPNKNIFCNYNFSSLFIWGQIYKTKWKFYKEWPIIYDTIEDFIITPPGRPLLVNELVKISDMLLSQGKRGRFKFADINYIDKNKEINDFFDLEIDEDHADYIYETKKLVDMKGKKLHKKKNLVSQFLRSNPGYTVKPILKEHFNECFKLAEKWCLDRNCEKIGFDHETSALKRAFDNFEELGFNGLALLVQEKMIAFAIFSEQNNNTADMHFEKYDSEFKGSEQVICWESAKHLLPKYKYMDREEDLGIEGLRQSKKSYDPEFILKTYKLHRKK